MATQVSMESLFDAVDQIAPTLRKHAAEAEANSRLSDGAAKAMKDAGLYAIWIPRAYGGLELDLMAGIRLVERVASIDSAAGWTLALSVGGSVFPAFFDEQAAAEIYADGASPMAGCFFPPTEAVPVEGGFRVNGRTPFGSGSHHCRWFGAMAHVVENGKERLDEQGQPETSIVFVPSSQIEIIDHWDTLGLRGTGSHDVAIRDAFVPKNRLVRMLAPEERTLGKGFEGPLYRCTVWPAVAALSAVATGIARAAIDELVALAIRKTPNYTPGPLRERSVAQMQLARAEAKLGAARAYLSETLRDAWQSGVAGRFVDLQQKHRIQRASIHAAEASAEAVDLVHAAAGSSGIRKEFPFERHFRDVHVITQHAFHSTARYESVGKPLVGLASDWDFFAY